MIIDDDGQWYPGMDGTIAFYNHKPCCGKTNNTVGSLILREMESPIRARHYTVQRHLVLKRVIMLEWIITLSSYLKIQ